MAMGAIKKACMKKAIFILLFSIISCKSQEKKTEPIQRKDSMEYFDKNYYGKLEIDPIVNMKKLPNGDHVVIDEFYEPIKETLLNVHKKNKPLIDSFLYDENNKIKGSGSRFYNIPINIQKEFDKFGKLIKEIDFEKDYKFSIDEVCKLIKTDYDVDLMIIPNPNIFKSIQYYVNRYKSEIYKDNFKECYQVVFYIQEGGGSKTVNIDGNTGEILFETFENGYALAALPKNMRIKVPTKEEFLKNKK
jgi:hypothetical protein